jgi:hypothetical protein
MAKSRPGSIVGNCRREKRSFGMLIQRTDYGVRVSRSSKRDLRLLRHDVYLRVDLRVDLEVKA